MDAPAPGPASPAPTNLAPGAALASAAGAPPPPPVQQRPLRLSANEVLVADGPGPLLVVMQYQARAWPIEGLFEMADFAEVQGRLGGEVVRTLHGGLAGLVGQVAWWGRGTCRGAQAVRARQ